MFGKKQKVEIGSLIQASRKRRKIIKAHYAPTVNITGSGLLCHLLHIMLFKPFALCHVCLTRTVAGDASEFVASQLTLSPLFLSLQSLESTRRMLALVEEVSPLLQ